jgi:hypothetical protein
MPAHRSKQPGPRLLKKRGTPLAPGRIDRAALQTVAQELCQLMVSAMTETGLSRQEQFEAFGRAMSRKKTSGRVAKTLLERSHAVADLLSYWQKNERYIDKEGAPRVLPIRGRGATLESLARQFVPDMPVSEVVTAIVRHGEVARLKGDRVALVGTIMLVTPSTPELTLAAVTLNAQRLIGTILYNSSLPQKQRGTLGHFQRYSTGELTQGEFNEWLHRVRPELQKYTVGSESSLRLADGKRPRGKSSGVGIFVFRDK